MKNELETLKEMRAELDAKIDKLIKPEFEVGKWYKIKYESGTAIINYIEKHKSYGFSYNSNWSNDFDVYGYENPITYTEATPTEVQEALEKEAVKRYEDNNKVKCLLINSIITFDRVCEIHYDSKTNSLFCGRVKLFNNGIWAEIQKTMTIDELACKFKEFGDLDMVRDIDEDFKLFLTENKTQIIETLNSI